MNFKEPSEERKRYVQQKYNRSIMDTNNELGVEIICKYRTNFVYDIATKAKYGANLNALIGSFLAHPHDCRITEDKEIMKFYIDNGWRFGIHDEPTLMMDPAVRNCLNHEINNSGFMQGNLCCCIYHINKEQCQLADNYCMSTWPEKSESEFVLK